MQCDLCWGHAIWPPRHQHFSAFICIWCLLVVSSKVKKNNYRSIRVACCMQPSLFPGSPPLTFWGTNNNTFRQRIQKMWKRGRGVGEKERGKGERNRGERIKGKQSLRIVSGIDCLTLVANNTFKRHKRFQLYTWKKTWSKCVKMITRYVCQASIISLVVE